MPKYVRDVFADYVVENNLIDSEIENINLYKKTNKLQMNVISNQPIGLSDIESFEKYAIKRFGVVQARVDIKYQDVEIEQNVEKEWKSIVSYIAKKEPFSRAILNQSHVEIKGKELSVKFAM